MYGVNLNIVIVNQGVFNQYNINDANGCNEQIRIIPMLLGCKDFIIRVSRMSPKMLKCDSRQEMIEFRLLLIRITSHTRPDY